VSERVSVGECRSVFLVKRACTVLFLVGFFEIWIREERRWENCVEKWTLLVLAVLG